MTIRHTLVPALGLALLVAAGPATGGDAPALPPPVHLPGAAPSSGGGSAGVARPAAAGPSDDLGVVVPDAPPRPPAEGTSHPLGTAPPGRDYIWIKVDPQVGRVSLHLVDESTYAAVLVGNPRIRGTDLDIKARTIVLWVDRSKAPDLGGFAVPEAPSGVSAGSRTATPGAEGRTGAPVRPAGNPGTESLVPEALLGVYAEGGVDLVTRGMAFRALELWLDPHANQALLIEPRFDTTLPIGQGPARVPILVRAARARSIARGLVVFDQAEATTSPANDRLAIEARTLTVEEYGQAQEGEPLFLGFRAFGSQRFAAKDIVGRGERLPLLYAPEVEFGGTEGMREIPLRIRRLTLAKRSSFGWYGFLGVGGRLGPQEDRWLDWGIDLGGYWKRGPAVGGELKWSRPRVNGKATAFYVRDATGEDRYGRDWGERDRWRATLENRWDPDPRWRMDVEGNVFSDRQVNREYFESDDRNHKDRETYGRVRWMDGGTAATATGGVHARDFRTETLQEPEVQLWSESLPVTPPGGIAGGMSIDLSSEVRAGYLWRAFDDESGLDDYEAYRVHARERLYAPFMAGDLRISPFVGGAVTGYYDRTDGGEDLTRAALEAGVRADLQLHRDYDMVGGPWGLDGLRHVIDLDLEFYGRFMDSHDAADAPFFDRVEPEEDRTEIVLEARNRWETRRPVAGRRQNAAVADMRLRASFWPDEIGPYGRRGPGEAEGWALGEVAPGTAWLFANGRLTFDSMVVERGIIGILASPRPELAFGAGFRHVQDEVEAPWVDGYWRWNEKWALRASVLYDIYDRDVRQYRLSILRFSLDHVLQFGVSASDAGDDLGVFFDFLPAIGGEPLRSPFDPRDALYFDSLRAREIP